MAENDKEKNVRLDEEIKQLTKLLNEVNEERLYCAVNACRLNTKMAQIQKEKAEKRKHIH